jgi:quinol-cytochrome oxidoreductase complex cytochrome b subunit
MSIEPKLMSQKEENKTNFFGRLWSSVFRGPFIPRSDRERRWIVFNNLILHFRPPRLPEKTLRYAHTFGLGGMSLVLFAVLAATGILLMFVYEPSPERAYESILSLQNEVVFGKLVRNVHHWSANFLIIVAFLHLLRVFFTEGFLGQRQFNWILGLCLFASILLSNFTGYLLPWDQLSYWAVTISTGMIEYVPVVGAWLKEVVRGGPEIGSSTLVTFYTLHTTVVPVFLVILMAFHFWRVRKAGGVVVPRLPGEDKEEKPSFVLFLPNLLLREAVVATVLIAIVMLFSIVADAPLDQAANPGMSPNPAKAPWYFAGIQELLFHFHPLFAVVVLPMLASLALVALPYVKYDEDTSGIWFRSHRGRRMGISAAVIAFIVTPVWILVDEFLDLVTWLPEVPPIVRDGVFPVGLLLAMLVVFYQYWRRRHDATNNESTQAVFILLLSALIVLTITCVWFRGAGMALMWPRG